jgi:hypothetical protein
MVATTLNGSGLFQYEQRLGDPDPFRNFLEARFSGVCTQDGIFGVGNASRDGYD